MKNRFIYTIVARLLSIRYIDLTVEDRVIRKFVSKEDAAEICKEFRCW